jgi:hypothetical protein
MEVGTTAWIRELGEGGEEDPLVLLLVQDVCDGRIHKKTPLTVSVEHASTCASNACSLCEHSLCGVCKTENNVEGKEGRGGGALVMSRGGIGGACVCEGWGGVV